MVCHPVPWRAVFVLLFRVWRAAIGRSPAAICVGKTKPRPLGRGTKPHAAFINRASGAGCQTAEAHLQGPSTLRIFLPVAALVTRALLRDVVCDPLEFVIGANSASTAQAFAVRRKQNPGRLDRGTNPHAALIHRAAM